MINNTNEIQKCRLQNLRYSIQISNIVLDKLYIIIKRLKKSQKNFETDCIIPINNLFTINKVFSHKVFNNKNILHNFS